MQHSSLHIYNSASKKSKPAFPLAFPSGFNEYAKTKLNLLGSKSKAVPQPNSDSEPAVGLSDEDVPAERNSDSDLENAEDLHWPNEVSLCRPTVILNLTRMGYIVC